MQLAVNGTILPVLGTEAIMGVINQLIENNADVIIDVRIDDVPAATPKSTPKPTPKPAPKPKHIKAAVVTPNATLTAPLPTVKPANAQLPDWAAKFNVEGIALIEVKASQINIKPVKGMAKKFHDAFRAEGFSWSKKKQFWWAPKDDARRADTAARNKRIDEVNASFTSDNERKAFWAEYRATSKA